MKCLLDLFSAVFGMSRPARGAWVEIKLYGEQSLRAETSRPARGAWVEIIAIQERYGVRRSRPARGAWVEIS